LTIGAKSRRAASTAEPFRAIAISAPPLDRIARAAN
jgi:hypothetical protein